MKMNLFKRFPNKNMEKGINFFPRNKKGTAGDDTVYPVVIFVILNLMFFSLLIYFVWSSSGGVTVLEQAYAKQIVLAIDSAKPGMEISIDMDDAFDFANKEGYDFSKVLSVDNESNVVYVRFHDRRGYGYKFFTDYEVNVFPDQTKEGELNGRYIIVVS